MKNRIDPRHTLWAIALLSTACGNEPPADPAASRPETPAPNEAPRATVATTSEPPAGRAHLDLLALAHLADVHHDGLYIPFGDRARWKYTHGRWAPVTPGGEWGRDTTVDREPATPLGTSGRIFFHLDRATALTIRVRARSLGANKLIAYIGERTLGEGTVSQTAGYRDIDFAVPAEAVSAGENVLLLRGDATAPFRGFTASAAIASVRIVPGTPRTGFVAPSLITRSTADGVERPALTLPLGTRVEHFVEVPAGARLDVRATSEGGRGSLSIDVATEEATDTTLTAAVSALEGGPIRAPAAARREVRSLASLEGKIVRLAIEAHDAPVRIDELRITFAPTQARLTRATAKNVIVVLIDTLRADRLRVNRPSSRVNTPAYDAFAAAGANFPNAQSPENWTKPSVASVLTSTYPATHGAKYDASSLAAEALLVSEVLDRAGFSTASFIANGHVSRDFGFDQGWDHYTNYIRESRATRAETVFGEAATWIEAHRSERFFAYVHTIDPHVPYDPPNEFLQMYDSAPYDGVVQNRRTPELLADAKTTPPRVVFTDRDAARLDALYDAEISYHDVHFGRFLARLDALGLADDTLVIVTADHGEEMRDHGSWGHGHSVFQELLNVPLTMRWEGVIPTGAVLRQTTSTVHVSPTVLEAVGIAAPPEFEGESLLGLVRGQPSVGPAVAFSDFQENRRVIRAGRFKLIVRGNLRSILFDLQTDPREQTDLATSARPIAARYLRVLLGQFLGAPDRGRWLFGDERRRVVPTATRARMTPELCNDLAALGYVLTECEPGAL